MPRGGGGGGTLIFSAYVGSDPASTFHPLIYHDIKLDEQFHCSRIGIVCMGQHTIF